MQFSEGIKRYLLLPSKSSKLQVQGRIEGYYDVQIFETVSLTRNYFRNLVLFFAL